MMKRILGATAVAALLAGPALAAQNVANTSQKGSLLIWPLITVDHSEGRAESTLIEISNDANATVHVECEYVNERKGRVNFDFDLSAKQTASWDAYTLYGDQVRPARFPTNTGNPPFVGNVYRGELICFATNPGRQFQISWNHLTGTATVSSGAAVTAPTTEEVSAPAHVFKYNAWSFAARNKLGVAAPNLVSASHGRPGVLNLNGQNADGVYDACPLYNIANFMPNDARLANVHTISNSLSVVSCYQDLRERYRIFATKLEFTVWNSFEHSFTGAHYCADSVTTVNLADPPVTQGGNFDYEVLDTPNARFQVRGVTASPPCPGTTVNAGLLGVISSEVALNGSEKANATVGNTLHGAGTRPGFVIWDPAGAVPLKASR